MKVRFSLVFLMVLTLTTVNSFGQTFSLTTTAANTNSSMTRIDLPGLANNPQAIIVATLAGNYALNPHPIGAWYYSGKWYIFNTDHNVMTEGLTFNLEVALTPDPNHFLHIIPQAETGQTYSIIDNPVLNDNPTAQVKILQNHAPDSRPYSLNPFRAEARYDSNIRKWCIVNVVGNSLSANTAYNIAVASGVSGTNPNPDLVKLPPKNPTPVLPPSISQSVNPNTPIGEATSKNPTAILADPKPQPPTGNAGGDLSGTYPNPRVQKLLGKPLSNVAPTTVGQILRWNGNEWEPGAKPSALSFNQSGTVVMNAPTLNRVSITGLDNQSFPLTQSSRIVFNTLVRAQNMDTNPLVGATHATVSVEILNASNIVVALSTTAAQLSQGTIQNINSVGIGFLPAGVYHTRVSIISTFGKTILETYATNGDRQGGQMIIEIFPD